MPRKISFSLVILMSELVRAAAVWICLAAALWMETPVAFDKVELLLSEFTLVLSSLLSSLSVPLDALMLDIGDPFSVLITLGEGFLLEPRCGMLSIAAAILLMASESLSLLSLLDGSILLFFFGIGAAMIPTGGRLTSAAHLFDAVPLAENFLLRHVIVYKSFAMVLWNFLWESFTSLKLQLWKFSFILFLFR